MHSALSHQGIHQVIFVCLKKRVKKEDYIKESYNYIYLLVKKSVVIIHGD